MVATLDAINLVRSLNPVDSLFSKTSSNAEAKFEYLSHFLMRVQEHAYFAVLFRAPTSCK